MPGSGVVDNLLDTPLTTGPAGIVFTVVAVVAVVVLVARRHARWPIVVAICVAVAAIVVLGARFLIEDVLRPFPDALPMAVYLWSACGVAGLLLGIGRIVVRDYARPHRLVGVVLVVASLATVVAAAGHVNIVYSAYPTVRTLLRIPEYREVSMDEVTARADSTVERGDLAQWQPGEMPSSGGVVTAPVPATVSHFTARDAHVYFPPAYFAEPRPLLPVLVLLAGQPGSTDDWLIGGRMARIMDSYAGAHRGVAPVVVLADSTGTEFANPLCVDSAAGNAATYLTVDVPTWVRNTFEVTPDPRGWAVGGLSYGGTCSLQLATTRPDVYPTFLDMSGQAEPSLGDHDRTVREIFGGDAAAFAANNPADILTHRRFPDSAGAFVVGADDRDFRPGLEHLADLTRSAGMDVHLTELPGSHSFVVWSAGLEKELPWLTDRLGVRQ